MNKGRRDELQRAIVLIETAKEIIEVCAEEERDYFDNMPESLQGAERGSKAEESAGTIEEAASSLDEVIELINTASE